MAIIPPETKRINYQDPITRADVQNWSNALNTAISGILSQLTHQDTIDTNYTVEYADGWIEKTADKPDESDVDIDQAFDDLRLDSVKGSTPSTKYINPNTIAFQDLGITIDTSGQPDPNAPSVGLEDFYKPYLPEFPEDLEYTEPVLPTLRGIEIPDFEYLPLPDIDGLDIPEVALPNAPVLGDYSETMYTSNLLNQTATELSAVLNGRLGIPDYLWDAIWNRASESIRKEGLARTRQATRQWAKQNWDMPGSVAIAQANQAAQEVLEQTSNKALEIATQNAMMKREDFWNGIQNTVAFETLKVDIHNQYYGRLLQYILTGTELAVSVYNASIAALNIRLEYFKLYFEKFKYNIEAAKLKLEENKIRLEAALANGEADKNDIQLYISQWEGVKAKVQTYIAELQAVSTEVDVQKLFIESQKADLENQTLILEGWIKEWDGWLKKLEGEKMSKLDVVELGIRKYAEEIKNYSAKVEDATSYANHSAAIYSIQNEVNNMYTGRYRAKVEKAIGEANAIVGKYNALVNAYRSEVDLATGTMQAKAASDQNLVQAAIADANATVELDKAKVDERVKYYEVNIKSLETLAQIFAQMVASAYGTMNYSFSDSYSDNISNSTQESYQESKSSESSSVHQRIYSCDC